MVPKVSPSHPNKISRSDVLYDSSNISITLRNQTICYLSCNKILSLIPSRYMTEWFFQYIYFLYLTLLLYTSTSTGSKMTIPHEWRVKSVNSLRESKKIVSRERSSSEPFSLLSRGELTDFTRHELQYCFYSYILASECQIH